VLANLYAAEVLEKSAMDEGVGVPAYGAEHEVAPTQLLDEGAGGALGTEIGQALQPLSEGVLQSGFVDEIAGEAALALCMVRATRRRRPRLSLKSSEALASSGSEENAASIFHWWRSSRAHCS
jgi:hypothetical protein